MNIYAIENDPRNLLLVQQVRCGLDYKLMVVNGRYELQRNKDGSLSPLNGNFKAYYAMRAPLTRNRQDYDEILNKAEEMLNDPDYGDMMIGG